jgi:hypothetical protein
LAQTSSPHLPMHHLMPWVTPSHHASIGDGLLGRRLGRARPNRGHRRLTR